jgi:hypothetical protein
VRACFLSVSVLIGLTHAVHGRTFQLACSRLYLTHLAHRLYRGSGVHRAIFLHW